MAAPRIPRNLVEYVTSMQELGGLSDGEVAERAGVSRSAWSLIRRGKSRPSAAFIGGVLDNIPGSLNALVHATNKRKFLMVEDD